MKRLVEDIETGLVPRPEFAIYVEPTQLDVFTAPDRPSSVCDITVTGRSAYFGMPEAGVDAAESRTRDPRQPVRPFGRTRGTRAASAGGTTVPVGDQHRGRRLHCGAGRMPIELILKLLQGESLDEAVASLETAVRSAPVDPAITISLAIQPAATIVSAARRPRRRPTGGRAAPRRGGEGDTARARRGCRRSILVRGAVSGQSAGGADGLLRAWRHQQLPHARRARHSARLSRRHRCLAAFLAGFCEPCPRDQERPASATTEEQPC